LDEGLGQLVELWLLEASEKLDESKRRYSLHPLTRFFAQHRLNENSELERQIKAKLGEFFKNFATEATGDKYSLEGYDQIEEEKDNIFSLIDWCFKNQEMILGIKLTKSVTFFMSLRGYPYESWVLGQKALDAARKLDNTDDLAWLLVKGIGWREINGGDLEKGEAMIREGLSIYEASNDFSGMITALHNLSRVLRNKGDFSAARRYSEQGFALSENLANKSASALFKRELAMVDAAQGKLLDAKSGLESILPFQRENDTITSITTMAFLADINFQLELYDDAYKIGIDSFELANKLKKREIVAWISRTLAHLEAARGNYQAALSLANNFLEFYNRPKHFSKRINEMKALIKELQQKLTA
jgi:tetratricopeptide (TPR) repeat protein